MEKVYLQTMADLLNNLTESNFEEVMTGIVEQFWEFTSHPALKKGKTNDWGIFASNSFNMITTMSTSDLFTPSRSKPLNILGADILKRKKITYLHTMQDLLFVLTVENFDFIFEDILREFKIFTEMKKHVTSHCPQTWVFECVFDS